MARIPSLFAGEVYPPVTSQTFTLSGKTARSGSGVIGRSYFTPIIQESVEYVKFGLFVPLGNPPDWPANTPGTFTLSSKVNRVGNTLLGRTARTWYVTIPSPISGFRANAGTTVSFASPTATSGIWRADASIACDFEAEFLDTYLIANAYGHSTWVGFSNVQNGFRADSNTTSNFNASATMLRMDARSSAAFTSLQVPAPTGFKAQGSGGARFMGAVGASEDCLTGTVPAMPRQPNFVY